MSGSGSGMRSTADFSRCLPKAWANGILIELERNTMGPLWKLEGCLGDDRAADGSGITKHDYV